MTTSPIAVYVHTPFCPAKCGYCDFNSYAMGGEIVERTVAAIEREIRSSSIKGRPAKTIFFGGGTPTMLSAQQLERLLLAVVETHPPVDGCEVTSEANPGTVDASKFADMHSAGFNRISIGAQSFNPSDLRQLGRVHEATDVPKAVRAARKAGFTSINLDLMFALPGQSTAAWRRNLSIALEMNPEHLSLYCLTIEPATRFYRHANNGLLNLPNEDSQVEMYDAAIEASASAGLEQYEISNFALPGHQCEHNLCYWRGEEYAGYGPGAVGRIGDTRSTNVKHPKRYCEAIEGGAPISCEEERLDPDTLRLERVMLGIRLNEGLPGGLGDSTALERTKQAGWTETRGERIRLTPAGRHFCSEVAVALS